MLAWAGPFEVGEPAGETVDVGRRGGGARANLAAQLLDPAALQKAHAALFLQILLPHVVRGGRLQAAMVPVRQRPMQILVALFRIARGLCRSADVKIDHNQLLAGP